ncbi:MAG TPA: Coq4 family protein [Rhizomicrobium sp.]|nr:Coq4 family protein [Rhizomicrobium sp.]
MEADKRSFEAAAVAAPAAATVRAAAAAAKRGDRTAAWHLAAAFCHCAFAAPETAPAVYAAFRAGWLGDGAFLAVPDVPPASLSIPFWRAFWDLFEAPAAPDALAITQRVVALGAFVDPALRARAEAVARAHPKAADAASRPVPPRLRLEDLARLPEGSLGHDFRRLIVDNRFDLEVLDREAMQLAALPPALRYLNTRILQMHDIWHLVGGFRTTALHEIAISAFQQAQFGHGYSAMFLAIVTSGSVLRDRDGTAIVLQTIAEASRHGEDCPSFMEIAWEAEWHRPTAEIRARHGIAPFAGTYPADLFERLRSAA